LKILLLEDDLTLHESIKAYLELENIIVTSSYCSDDVYKLTYTNKYDLYLFDINVEGDDGLQILHSLREANDNTPAIFITALNDISTFTKAFKYGADDYIKKPFSIEELIIKIKLKYKKEPLIKYKHIKYNALSKQIIIDSQTIYLSTTLLNIFDELITNINKVIIYDILLEYIENESKNGLKTTISQLKNKLKIDITNIRGIGYKIEAV